MGKCLSIAAVTAVLELASCFAASKARAPLRISPATMARIGTVDRRFQSYNIEMVEVTGGQFWKPYKKRSPPLLGARISARAANSQLLPDAGRSQFQYRPPIDLSNPLLRRLAAALGPAYLRVSGGRENSTYFQDSDDPVPLAPPRGFDDVLTRRQWKGVIEFSRAVDAQIVTSFATSAGTRDASGVWNNIQASHFLRYTQSIGGNIAAAEFMNEPNLAKMGGGVSKDYDAAAYALDIKRFVSFMHKAAPNTILLGPGSTSEGLAASPAPGDLIKTESLLALTGPVFDAFSYHFYGAVSSRCAGARAEGAGTTIDDALSNEWLSRTDRVEAFYSRLRDRFLPGKPIWNTETAQAACGGDWWASTFVDTFRYLNQLGSLSSRGVNVVAHNTLLASDYGLLDENTLVPRPDYWGALLWRELMGTVVLNPGQTPAPTLHLYAHCLRNHSGGVALLVINTDQIAPQSLDIPSPSERYTLTARNLLQSKVQLNGTELKLDSRGALPSMRGVPVLPGQTVFGPASITFISIPQAQNAACN